MYPLSGLGPEVTFVHLTLSKLPMQNYPISRAYKPLPIYSLYLSRVKKFYTMYIVHVLGAL